MRTRNDLSRSFCLVGSPNTFHSALAPAADMMQQIQLAERAVRACLEVELPKRLMAYLPPGVKTTVPKFKKQGSAAYGLLNDPLRGSVNYNEADSDLGVYMPLGTLKKCTDQPAFAADIYLTLVYEALHALALKNGWSTVKKRSCIRIKIRRDAHLDVTCYVVPEAEFSQMRVAFAERLRKSGGAFDASADASPDLTWEEIPDRPLLATKDGWVPSDAKAIHALVDHAAAVFGPAFKRTVRYVKGERDYADDAIGPCSIGITVILARHTDPRALVRDDLGVLSALGIVADHLTQHVATPGNEQVDILKDVPMATRVGLAARLRQAQARVNSAIFDLDREQAHDVLRSVFGSRFPKAADAPSEREEKQTGPSIIIRDEPKRIAAVAPAGNVRSA
jgi:hypothetical protein